MQRTPSLLNIFRALGFRKGDSGHGGKSSGFSPRVSRDHSLDLGPSCAPSDGAPISAELQPAEDVSAEARLHETSEHWNGAASEAALRSTNPIRVVRAADYSAQSSALLLRGEVVQNVCLWPLITGGRCDWRRPAPRRPSADNTGYRRPHSVRPVAACSRHGRFGSGCR